MNFTQITNPMLPSGDRICMTTFEFEKNFKEMCNITTGRPIIFMGVTLVFAILEPYFLNVIMKIIDKNGKYIFKNKYISIKYEDLYFGYRMAKIGFLILAIILAYFGKNAYVGG